MENKRKALGRGLEQLFNNESLNFDSIEKTIMENATKDDIIEINLSELRSNPYQPRKVFEQDKLVELANSIKQFGVLEPIIVKKSIKGYEIVAGERRVKASSLASKDTIPAIVKDFTDEEMMQVALLENIQREDLSAIEEAWGYKNLIKALGVTQNELADKIGKSRSYVTNMLGLLRLSDNVQNMVLNKQLSMGHARALSKLEDAKQIESLAKRVIDESLSVRNLENILGSNTFERTNEIKREKKDNTSPYKHVENKMREIIGNKVKISNKSITIPFMNEKDLERILNTLNIKMEEE